MDDRGVAQADGEAELVHGDAEETEIEKNPNVAAGPAGAAGVGGFGEGGQAQADEVNEDHEDGGEDEAERSKGERVHVTESDFASEEIEGPDGNEKGDGGREYTAAGGLASAGVNAHESSPWGRRQKRNDNTEFTEERAQRTQRRVKRREFVALRRKSSPFIPRKHRDAQRSQRTRRMRHPQVLRWGTYLEEPKTQAHTPCLGHPASLPRSLHCVPRKARDANNALRGPTRQTTARRKNRIPPCGIGTTNGLLCEEASGQS